MSNATDQALWVKADMENYFFRAWAVDFKKIPGSPIAYWVSAAARKAFIEGESFGDMVKPRQGLATGCNDIFLKEWHEVSFDHIGFGIGCREEANDSGFKWFPYNKGGSWRKWYGNCEYVVDWQHDGLRIRDFRDDEGKVRSRPQNTEFYFQESITWADITTSSFAARYSPRGSIFDVKGSSGFPSENQLYPAISLMNSKLMHGFMLILNPTSTFQVGDMARVPFASIPGSEEEVAKNAQRLISTTKADWDSFEFSWEFSSLPLLRADIRHANLKGAYAQLRAEWSSITLDVRCLEERSNRIFIDAYDLQDELTPEVPLKEITLTCNPHYRYGDNKTDEELEALLLADTMREFISYAVGCMFGRYSLDKPGLVLANQGDTLADYLHQVPQPTFTPGADNVIPLLDGEWFPDDITERFRSFLRLTFGEAHYADNLKFIEDALGKDIRRFFLRDFYNDHVKRYKKRPIYWLFSSPKGSFNALIYLHRYRPDTVSVVLQYLRDFQEKLAGERKRQEQISISASASQAEKTRALKSIDSLKKTLAELEDYEREVLHPLATQQIDIDLDDGVKANYVKFGKALKRIPGLAAKEED